MAAQAAVLTSSVLDVSTNQPARTSSPTIAADGTLSPIGFDRNQPGVARWVDRTGGIPVGYPTLTLSVREPQKGSSIVKVTAKLDLPTLEQTSPSTATGIQPAPTKAYSCQAVLEFMLPVRSTQAERQALFRRVASLFHAQINASDDSPTSVTGSPLRAAVDDMEPVW